MMTSTLILAVAVMGFASLLLAAIRRFELFGLFRPPSASEPDYLNLLLEYEQKKRWMEAMVIAKAGIRAFPPGIGFRLGLARIRVAQGDRRQAVAELQVLLRLAPGHIDAKHMLAELNDSVRPT
ncbi:MAG: hypothetical protein HY901_02110 [Deltaproteobacteria bacterium]|nr:hypothetical protein [Deltaproteobacteria bacterium]